MNSIDEALNLNVVQDLRQSLLDPSQPSTNDIVLCGPGILELLFSSFTKPICASSLLALANEHIQSTPFNLVERCWLRLYVDASIALALNNQVDGIRLLDMTIIIAGAVGDGRMECIQTMIRQLQGPRERLSESLCGRTALHPHAAPEDDIPSILPPSLHTYRTRCHLPFVLRGYIDWPALHKWTSFDYLVAAPGKGRIVPVERGLAYDHPDWGQEIISWRDFLTMVSSETPNEIPPYLAQHSLFNQFPILQGDIGTPDYVWSDPELAHDRPAEPIINAWIGSGVDGVISPPHTDPYFNCFVQVLGHKRIWLAPPDADVQGYEDSEDLTGYMRNTSPLKVFETPHKGMYATLHPGDLLVFPPKWWHSTMAVGTGIVWNVSFWY